jgi:hypothetical protein
LVEALRLKFRLREHRCATRVSAVVDSLPFIPGLGLEHRCKIFGKLRPVVHIVPVAGQVRRLLPDAFEERSVELRFNGTTVAYIRTAILIESLGHLQRHILPVLGLVCTIERSTSV